jgi:hypothetical protein
MRVWVAALWLTFFLAAVSPAAASWSTPAPLSDASSGIGGSPTQVGTDSSGRVFAMSYAHFPGRADLGLREAVLSPKGQLRESAALSTGEQDTADPSMAVDGSGDALFGWTRVPHDDGRHLPLPRRVQVRQRTAAGTLRPLSDASNLSDETVLGGVGIASDGGGLVLMSDEDAGTLLLRSISPQGALGPVETVATAGAGRFAAPAIHVYANGDALIAWVRYESEQVLSPVVVQAQYRHADGTWGPVRSVSGTMTNAINFAPKVVLAGDSSGNGLVVWNGWDGQFNRVRARRIGFSGLGPVQTFTPSGVDALTTTAVLRDDGAALIGWELWLHFGAPGSYLRAEAQWLLPDGTRSVVARPAPAGGGTSSTSVGVALNGAHSAWLGVQYGLNQVEVRTFGDDGSLGSRVTVPAPAGKALEPVIATEPTGQLAVAYAQDAERATPAYITVSR